MYPHYTLLYHTNMVREAVMHFLKSDTISDIQRNFILSLLDYAMGHIYFWFGGSYLQNKGVAMGAKFKPSMANLF